jgi:hypothetical protein
MEIRKASEGVKKLISRQITMHFPGRFAWFFPAFPFFSHLLSEGGGEIAGRPLTPSDGEREFSVAA